MHSVMRSDFLNRFLSLDRFQRDSRLHVCAETPPLPRFHSAPFRGSRFYTLFTGPNFGEQLRTRCDEHTFLRPLAVQSAYEPLDLWPSDRSFPFFRLEVHNIETKSILANNAVYSFVTTPADCLAGILTRTAVTHCQQQFDNQAFEELGRRPLYAREQFGC